MQCGHFDGPEAPSIENMYNVSEIESGEREYSVQLTSLGLLNGASDRSSDSNGKGDNLTVSKKQFVASFKSLNDLSNQAIP